LDEGAGEEPGGVSASVGTKFDRNRVGGLPFGGEFRSTADVAPRRGGVACDGGGLPKPGEAV